MTDTIAGIATPDSALAKEATELVRDVATPLVFDHSRRVYLFGALRARARRHHVRPGAAVHRCDVP